MNEELKQQLIADAEASFSDSPTLLKEWREDLKFMDGETWDIEHSASK